MPSFTQFIDQSGNQPFIVTQEPDNSQVEPLDGPASIDALMDRFPESIYAQGPDTHLYRFLQALCGDSGAGLIRKQAFIARLRNEGYLLTYTDLDTFYAQHLRFERLKSETYTSEPNVDALTKEEWDAIEKADQSYWHRVLDFFNGTRLGNTPDGLSLVARSGSGVDCEIVENYRAIYDTYSDDQLGLTPVGLTSSPSEFIVNPLIRDDDVFGVSYSSPLTKTTNPLTGAVSWSTTPQVKLSEDIERNVTDVLDRVRPAGSFMTIEVVTDQWLPITWADEEQRVFASSEHLFAARFVTGNAQVQWPEPDTTTGEFIVAGIEREATHLPLTRPSHPVVFHTLETAHAYTDQALDDPDYNTAAFYNDKPAPFLHYASSHVGSYLHTITSIYPVLGQVPTDLIFSPLKALAVQDTILVLHGRGK